MSWLPALLTLPQHELPTLAPKVEGRLEEARWEPSEKALPAPGSLLRWLVSHPEDLARPSGALAGSAETLAQRESLLRGDGHIRDEALRLLEQADRSLPAWYVLEGPTYPDVFLRTDDAIIVIEGKRTEADVTRSTTWMPMRHQMLRHLDGAWEARKGRAVYGLFIVEGDGDGTAVAVPERWQRVCAETVTPETLSRSLPHRSAEERGAIARGYLGVTTWQRICAQFDIPWRDLPDRA